MGTFLPKSPGKRPWRPILGAQQRPCTQKRPAVPSGFPAIFIKEITRQPWSFTNIHNNPPIF
jgi:hypothetical protein